MNETRLIELLKAFSIEEFKSFENYLNSPFLNSSKKVIDFYRLLKKFAPDFKRKIYKKKIFEELFPEEIYDEMNEEVNKKNERKLINLMQSLTKSAEYFLVYTEMRREENKENEIEFLLNLAKIYIDRRMPKNSMRIINNIEEILQPRSLKKDDNSRNKRLTKLKIRYYTEFKDYEKQIESMKEYFEVSAINFLWDALEVKLSIEPIESVVPTKIETPFIKGVLEAFDFEKLILLIDEKEVEIEKKIEGRIKKSISKKKKGDSKK